MRIGWLGWVEGLAVVLWLVLASVLIGDGGNDRLVRAIDPKALVLGPSQERWMGILFDDQHVGFSVSRSASIEGGGMLFEGRSQFRVATFGKIQQVTTAGTALVNATGALEQFDFVMLADQVRLVARGEVKGREIVMEVDQAGETSTLRFDVSAPPHVGMSLESAIRRQELAVGLKFSVPYFDPLTLSVPDRLVYTPHDYSWFHGEINSYDDLAADLGGWWGFLIVEDQPWTAPVWVGEFGTCNTSASCVQSSSPGGAWFEQFITYLSAGDIDWAYWPLNGTMARADDREFGAVDWYGVLNETWTGGELPELIESLQGIQEPWAFPE